MLIRPETDELEAAISIALETAPDHALRNAVSLRGRLERQVAINTITATVVEALRRYEFTREPNPSERGMQTLPLFPELRV